MYKTIGIVTGSGDAPGLNAVIRAVVKTAVGEYGMRVIGIEDSSYTSSPFNVGKNLRFRRRILQTVVDVRSLG